MRTILVTGASSGIGAASAKKMAGENSRLILVSYQNRAGLEETRRFCEQAGSPTLAVTGDVADSSFCQELGGKVRGSFPSPDVLVNCAGISITGLFQDMQDTDWQRLMAVNTGSVFLLTKEFLPDMIRRQAGRIINISSVWGIAGASCEAVYSASKGAVNAFTKAMARELAPSHICVNAIACGAIDTPMNAWLSEEEREALIDEIPAGRLGGPEEIADVAAFLADAPEYLTGQVITVDGGWQ